MKSCQIEEKS
ncbi:hypothetical protein CP8484711_0054A, partial [Chlamydia psittaci 84-8471/1]